MSNLRYKIGDVLRIKDLFKYKKIKKWKVLEDTGYYWRVDKDAESMMFEIWEICDSFWPFGKKKYKINRCDQSFLDRINSKNIDRKYLVLKKELSEESLDEIFSCERVNREDKLLVLDNTRNLIVISASHGVKVQG